VAPGDPKNAPHGDSVAGTRSRKKISTGTAFPPAAWEDGGSLPPGLGNRPLTGIRARVVAAHPDNIAVVEQGKEGGPTRRLTHRTLDLLVSRWAARLASEGVTPGAPIGLCAEAELEMPVGFLAILEAGGVVVPLDPLLPTGRLRAMADGVGCRMILVTKTTRRMLADGRLLNLSDDPGDRKPASIPADADRAAVIYHTSGSTGRPKPVALSHRAISSRILSMIDWFGIGADEVVCAGSSLAFDPFLQQLFFSLCTGGTLWLPDRISLLDPARFWAEAAEQGVTYLNLVPSQLDPLLRHRPDRGLVSLRRVVIGGERMPSDLPARIAAALGPVAIYNMYGPTEATVDATGHHVDPAVAGRDIPIGAPLPGCRVRILDKRLRRVPVGQAGELCIGGAGLAIGYRGMDEATAESFIRDPFGVPGDRLYRTGDLAQWLPDGQIVFIGRRDDQVKIRGQRIELGEVEAALRAFPGVAGAAAVKWEEAPGGASLIAHFVGDADPTALRAFLVERLPPAAVPVHLLQMAALPALPSGKIDRAALPRPILVTPSAKPVARQGLDVASLEESIAAVWTGLLGRASVDVTANLFEMGAHSLLVPRALAAIEAATGKAVSAVDLFRFPSVAALARHLSGEAAIVSGIRRRSESTGEIAIIGMAFRFPGASDRETFWADLMAGTDRIRRFDPAALRKQGAPAILVDHPDFVPAHGEIDDVDRFDPLPFGYSQGEAAEIDPQQRLLLELAWHALEDAACDPAMDGPVGVFTGVGFNSYLLDNLRDRIGFAGGADRYSVVIGSDKDFAATRIAYKLGLTGPAMTVNSACSTALSVTAVAVDSLRAGRCRVALAGAVSRGMFSVYGHIYAEGGIASRSGVCRPFDAEADGLVAGAGAAVLVLKRLDDAVADGDRIHAVIRGIGITNDGGRKAAFSAPSVDGQAAAIATAIEDAGVSPAEIGFVEGHGTATALGDPIEVTALNLVYRGAEPGSILLGSVKSNLGHLDVAAGMAGLIKAALSVGHGTVPPTAHFAAANPRIPFADGPFRVNAAPEPWPGPADRPRLAGVSAFGMGGTNIHAIIGAAPNSALPVFHDGPVLMTLSAATAAGRDRLAATLADDLADPRADHQGAPLADIASSLARRRPMRFRRAIVSNSAADAATALRVARELDGEASGGTVATAFLFPGQGAQHAGMARALYGAVPTFRAVIDEADRILSGSPVADLRALLLADSDDKAATAMLAETEWTQPALFVTEFAVAKALEAFGIRPTSLIGHSVGEYVAACLAGVMGFEDALRLVVTRCRLMASAPRGAMLAISMPEADVLPLLARFGADLAAVNSPRQCVASGTKAHIASLAEEVAALGRPARLLRVSHAFHSALMEPILDAFAAELAKTRLSAPEIPIVSNLSGDWLKPDEATDPTYWVRHARGTVRFADGLQCLTAGLTRLLVEAGPGAVLTRLARGAGVSKAHAIATQSPEAADGNAAFLDALGRLWVAGAPVDRLAAAGNADRRVPLPGYPFERVRLWIEPGESEAANPETPTAAVMTEGPPGTDAAAVIAAVWRDVLGVKAVGPEDDFLALGGDSLIAVRIAARLRQRLGCEVAPCAVFREGTVAGLARFLDTVHAASGPTEITGRCDLREEGWL
jgi:amino acid adenylation domain-containing protein